MVRFSVETAATSAQSARVGEILSWGTADGLKHSTPSFLTYTRAGHVPHLTWPVFKDHVKFRQKPIFQLDVPSFFLSSHAIAAVGKGVAGFCAMPENAPIHLSLFDGLAQRYTGYNDNSSVSIWTRAGRRSITPAQIQKLAADWAPASFELAHDYDMPAGISGKKSAKAIVRTDGWTTAHLEAAKVDAHTIPVVGGGYSAFNRRRMSEIARKCEPISSAASFDLKAWTEIGEDVTLTGPAPTKKRRRSSSRSPERKENGDHNGSGLRIDKNVVAEEKVESPPAVRDFAELDDMLREPLRRVLPEKWLRIAPGPFSPDKVWLLVQMGFDLFDSSWPSWLADRGRAFRVSDRYPDDLQLEIVDTHLDALKDEWKPPFEGKCDCYSCANFQLGYWQHLTNTDELLGPILLTIHNLAEWDRMFELIRRRLKRAN